MQKCSIYHLRRVADVRQANRLEALIHACQIALHTPKDLKDPRALCAELSLARNVLGGRMRSPCHILREVVIIDLQGMEGLGRGRRAP